MSHTQFTYNSRHVYKLELKKKLLIKLKLQLSNTIKKILTKGNLNSNKNILKTFNKRKFELKKKPKKITLISYYKRMVKKNNLQLV